MIHSPDIFPNVARGSVLLSPVDSQAVEAYVDTLRSNDWSGWTIRPQFSAESTNPIHGLAVDPNAIAIRGLFGDAYTLAVQARSLLLAADLLDEVNQE